MDKPKPKPNTVYLRLTITKDAPVHEKKFNVNGNEFDTWEEAEQEIDKQVDHQVQVIRDTIQQDEEALFEYLAAKENEATDPSA